jgi:hypothetical protein
MPLLTTRESVPFALPIALPHIAKMFLVPMLRNVNKCYGKLRYFWTFFCML